MNWRDGESQFWVIPWSKQEAVTAAVFVLIAVALFAFTAGTMYG